MIYFGETAKGTKEKMADWKKILQITGKKGSWTWAVPGVKETTLQLSESASVKITLPLTITYEFISDKLILTFSQPYPLGHYKIFNKWAQSITVGTDRIEVELLMSPNGYLDIK